jgi:hypothetical protein
MSNPTKRKHPDDDDDNHIVWVQRKKPKQAETALRILELEERLTRLEKILSDRLGRPILGRVPPTEYTICTVCCVKFPTLKGKDMERKTRLFGSMRATSVCCPSTLCRSRVQVTWDSLAIEMEMGLDHSWVNHTVSIPRTNAQPTQVLVQNYMVKNLGGHNNMILEVSQKKVHALFNTNGIYKSVTLQKLLSMNQSLPPLVMNIKISKAFDNALKETLAGVVCATGATNIK